jgi:succinyl-diaminopimelate desuccinylase
VLDRVVSWAGRSVTLDGCEYVEQLQSVAVAGGVAGNVVPDAASLTVNYRFAPDRDAAGARQFLGALFDELLDEERGDRWEVLDEADGAPPALDHPLLAALVAGAGAPPRAKAGWTDVASFWAHGVPAANFGPGDPHLAHHPDERVDRADLDRTRSVLHGLLSRGG